jgi:hypothetical protein
VTSDNDIRFETFEFEADAWSFLYENGFVARLANHREFDHPDGRWAVVLPGDDGDPETEVKIVRPPPHG